MDKRFVLIYGSDLDYSKIDYIVKEILLDYSMKSQKQIDIQNKIEFVFDTFDFNPLKHRDNEYIFGTYYLNEEQFQMVEKEFKNLKGHLIQLKPNHRGHYFIQFEDKEYTARVFVTLDNVELIFIDKDSYWNEILRKKIYSLPQNNQFLRISVDEIEDYNDRKILVGKWIKELLLTV